MTAVQHIVAHHYLRLLRYGICIPAAAFILFCWIEITCAESALRHPVTYEDQGNDAFYSRAHGSHGRALSECATKTPAIPNVLQPTKIDPYRFLGRWYAYIRFTNEDLVGNAETFGTAKLSNYVNTYNAMANETLVPTTGDPAVLVEHLFSYWDHSTSQCGAPEAYLVYLTPEGGASSLGTTGPDAYFMDNSVILATDYSSYAIGYACAAYNLESGLCGYPFIYAMTRTRPDQVTSETIDTVARTVRDLLGQYCVTIDMFVPYLWTASVGECPLMIPTDPCYVSLRQGYLDLAGASV